MSHDLKYLSLQSKEVADFSSLYFLLAECATKHNDFVLGNVTSSTFEFWHLIPADCSSVSLECIN